MRYNAQGGFFISRFMVAWDGAEMVSSVPSSSDLGNLERSVNSSHEIEGFGQSGAVFSNQPIHL